MAAHHVEDANGNLLNTVLLCSDACHRLWCDTHGQEYPGLSPSFGEHDTDVYCAQCGVRCSIGLTNDRCDARCLPVVVNLIGPTFDTCRHGTSNCSIRHEKVRA